MPNVSITSQLLDLNSTIERIESGEFLIIAADESLLAQLPSGNWIGGSIPYFMGDNGGLVSKEHIFVNAIEGLSGDSQPRITPYDAKSISRIAQDAPDNGFTVAIIPAGTDVHSEYAQNAPSYQNMFFSPLIGWIAGVHLDEVESSKAKTIFGPGAMAMEDKAVAMHVSLPTNQLANIHIVNLFEQGNGPKIRFTETGFNVKTCTVDGVETNLADYISQNNVDTRLPLVADYNGINVNVSIQSINGDNIALYAPVFADIEYQFATPVPDYVSSFNQAMSGEATDKSEFGVNCILNFLYSELEGKQTGKLTGPITFGEIAYQLLNQTLVYMSIDNA
ncbi:hypothetical protein NBRC116188_06950 [Oceaniserpentilla sp. 4NH20-0058]|uniref:DUF6976 family protein n=1 Tax=Oceaniserpentilla sp. 4NH20-0058 TaxID=3127660 RepID=UPI003103A192